MILSCEHLSYRACVCALIDVCVRLLPYMFRGQHKIIPQHSRRKSSTKPLDLPNQNSNSSGLVLTSSYPINHGEIHTLWSLHNEFYRRLLHHCTIRLRRLNIGMQCMQNRDVSFFLPCHKCAQLVTFVYKWQQYTTTLPTAQISDFLTFWGTRDFIIAVSSQSRGQRHCVCSCTCHRDPAQTCRKIICKRKQLFLLFYYGIYMPFGWSLALTHADNLRGMFSCCKSSRLW